MTPNIISWIFSVVFLITGILNAILVHPVPAAFYIILSIIYLPWTNEALKRRLGFAISFAAKVVVGIVVLWGTLAVGDLAEILGL